MRTVTVKTNDDFFCLLEEMTNELEISKSELIRTSILFYKENLEKETLKKKMLEASMKIRTATHKELTAFEGVSNDGL